MPYVKYNTQLRRSAAMIEVAKFLTETFLTDRRPLNPFSTAVGFWGQATQVLSTLSPKRDSNPERVERIIVEYKIRFTTQRCS